VRARYSDTGKCHVCNIRHTTVTGPYLRSVLLQVDRLRQTLVRPRAFLIEEERLRAWRHSDVFTYLWTAEADDGQANAA